MNNLPFGLLHIDSFIIGAYLSQYYLGIYKQPYQLINNIFSVLTASIFSILFSALSRYNDVDDNEKYLDTLIKTEKMLSIIIIPLGLGMFVYRSFVTSILLGKQWHDAEIVVGAFAIERVIQILINNSASEIYRSKGKPNLSVMAQIIFMFFLITGCLESLKIGFNEFVIVRASMCMVFALIHFVIIYKNFKINIFVAIPRMKNIIISAIMMSIIAVVLRNLFSDSIFMTFISVLLCIIIYFMFLIFFKDTRSIIINELNKLKKYKGISSIAEKFVKIIGGIKK